MTRSLKAMALAALLALGSAAAVTESAAQGGTHAGYMVARAQTGGEISTGDTSTGPVGGGY
ncbi:MAG TPA: hypothetical protein VKF35_04485 [Hyphomicrobiaceae bacterium]|nr:hypothetical protein [Hyphomicrobiaceae bacterium]